MKPRYGNCLFGALMLMWRFRTWQLRYQTWQGVPHFYVVDRNGARWDFKTVEDLLPGPFRYLLFKGVFRKRRF